MRPSRVLVPAVAVIVAVSAASAACAHTGSAPGGSRAATHAAARSAASTGSAPPRAAHTAATRAPANWPGYHGGSEHHGVSTTMPSAGALDAFRRLTLDGAVYGSPIVVNGTIVVATENDSVYGFTTAGKQKWRRHLGTPSPASQRPCGDIDPLGITGSPVYSSKTGDVYVVAETGTPAVRHTLYALNLRSGGVRWHRSVDFAGRDAAAMQQRGALALSGTRVWVTFGGLAGDCGNYVGRLIGVPRTGKGSTVRYSVPSAREAGMWQASGPSVAPDGRIFTSVGNGAAGSGDAYDHSDSVLQFTTAAKLQQSFSPTSWAQDNAGDVDLGSVGPALVGSKWIVQGGKSNRVFVLRQGRLGGIGGQVSTAQICASYGGAAVAGSTVYLPCTDGVRALRVDGTGQLHVLWKFSPGAPGSPVVGGGRVWILDPGNGVLYAASESTGAVKEQVKVGTTSRFATPALYGRLVLVPTMTGLTMVRGG